MPDCWFHSKIFLQGLSSGMKLSPRIVSRNVSEEWGAFIQGWRVQEALNPWRLRDYVPSKRRKTVIRHRASFRRRLRSSATWPWKVHLVFVQLCNVYNVNSRRNLLVKETSYSLCSTLQFTQRKLKAQPARQGNFIKSLFNFAIYIT